MGAPSGDLMAWKRGSRRPVEISKRCGNMAMLMGTAVTSVAKISESWAQMESTVLRLNREVRSSGAINSGGTVRLSPATTVRETAPIATAYLPASGDLPTICSSELKSSMPSSISLERITARLTTPAEATAAKGANTFSHLLLERWASRFNAFLNKKNTKHET